MKINLALSGGGIKGIAHLGGIKALEENDIEIVAIAGSSVGSIIASLYGAGYSCPELREIIYNKSFVEFKDGFLLNLYRLIFNYGVYKGLTIFDWLEEKLAEKKVSNFSDLAKDVRIVVSDINCCCSRVFSKKNTPNYSVAKAVRMSLSIPVLYQPYLYNQRFCVDGGVINNLPLMVFKESNYPTLGFLLVNSNTKIEKKIDNFLEYLAVIIETFISINELRQIELSRSQVISIATGDISSISFDLSKAEKKELYNSGYQQVYQNIDKFKDRRLTLVRGKGFSDLSPTVVEVEEISKLMVDYIKMKVELKEINGIVALAEDDYLFSFLVAQRLNKKFSIIDLTKNKSKKKNEYRYNQITKQNKVIILNYSLAKKNNLAQVINKLRTEEIEIAAVFNFFAQQREFHLNSLKIPFYNYN